MIRRVVLVAILLPVVAGCKREQAMPPPAAAADTTSRANAATGDSVAFASLAASMAALEARIEALGNDTTAAVLLFTLGEMKSRAVHWMWLGYGESGAGASYAKARPREYVSGEPDATYVYTGVHWQQVLERFPESGSAARAGWALAHRRRGGECEHDLACALKLNVIPLVEFLERFPSSEWAAPAVEEANRALAATIAPTPGWSLDSAAAAASIDSVTARYETLSQGLSEHLRVAVRQAVDAARERSRSLRPRP